MKTRLTGLMAIAALTLLLGGVGVASAKTYKAKSPIQAENGNCGANEATAKVLGSVTYKRTGNTVSVKVKFAGPHPNTDFDVTFWGNGCKYLGEVATFKTSSNGKGKASGTITVPEADTEFFADAYSEGDNDTPYVSLP